MKQHVSEIDITAGFEYDDDEDDGSPSSDAKQIGIKALTLNELEDSPFAKMAKFVAKERQVRSLSSPLEKNLIKTLPGAFR